MRVVLVLAVNFFLLDSIYLYIKLILFYHYAFKFTLSEILNVSLIGASAKQQFIFLNFELTKSWHIR